MDAQEIRGAAGRFGSELSSAIGDALEAVVLYGSLVKGDYSPATSDHNVALVLKDDHAAVLRGISATMRKARPSDRTTLLVLTQEEIANARDVFPLKFQDIARAHETVHGDASGLGGMTFDRQHLVLDCETQLRGIIVAVRRFFIRGDNDQKVMRANLVGSFKRFLPPMAGLCELAGKPWPKTKSETVNTTGQVIDAPMDALQMLLALTKDTERKLSPEEANAALDGYMKCLKLAAACADNLEGGAA